MPLQTANPKASEMYQGGYPLMRERPREKKSIDDERNCFRNRFHTRIVRVQVRTRPIRDGLDAVLRGLLTIQF